MRRCAVQVLLVLGLALPPHAEAYSVLAHEANVDALWDSTIVPILLKRFPDASPEQIQEARAYAYGGCVIQDLGYYPFGSHFFRNLLHYVRAGEFIETLIRDSTDVDEYAFALGALGHYAADNGGHPLATNRAVPLMYPKLKAQFGNSITYQQSPRNHVLVEFSFDVVQVAAAAKIGPLRAFSFSVPTPEAERLFLDSFTITRERFRELLDAQRAGRLHLANTNFDTGQPTARGEYMMADEAYDELLGKLADRAFANVPNELRADLVAFYGDADSLPAGTQTELKRAVKIRQYLAQLDATKAVP